MDKLWLVRIEEQLKLRKPGTSGMGIVTDRSLYVSRKKRCAQSALHASPAELQWLHPLHLLHLNLLQLAAYLMM